MQLPSAHYRLGVELARDTEEARMVLLYRMCTLALTLVQRRVTDAKMRFKSLSRHLSCSLTGVVKCEYGWELAIGHVKTHIAELQPRDSSSISLGEPENLHL